ncbi:MAG: hypothetical protein K8T25_21630 [Planctomycetia bacterium]|nr:hypothetical protein [Planctomycetia bacterium]
MNPWRITLIELVVVIAIGGVLAALLIPANGIPPPLTDKELPWQHLQVVQEDTAPPPEALRVRAVELTGTWTDRVGYTQFTIKPLADGRCSVLFHSRVRCGLGGSVQLERTATFDDGVLQLDRPVFELYGGATYRRLYTVKMMDKIYLLPSVHVAEIRDGAAVNVPDHGVMTRLTQTVTAQ